MPTRILSAPDCRLSLLLTTYPSEGRDGATHRRSYPPPTNASHITSERQNRYTNRCFVCTATWYSCLASPEDDCRPHHPRIGTGSSTPHTMASRQGQIFSSLQASDLGALTSIWQCCRRVFNPRCKASQPRHYIRVLIGRKRRRPAQSADSRRQTCCIGFVYERLDGTAGHQAIVPRVSLLRILEHALPHIGPLGGIHIRAYDELGGQLIAEHVVGPAPTRRVRAISELGRIPCAKGSGKGRHGISYERQPGLGPVLGSAIVVSFGGQESERGAHRHGCCLHCRCSAP